MLWHPLPPGELALENPAKRTGFNLQIVSLRPGSNLNRRTNRKTEHDDLQDALEARLIANRKMRVIEGTQNLIETMDDGGGISLAKRIHNVIRHEVLVMDHRA